MLYATCVVCYEIKVSFSLNIKKWKLYICDGLMNDLQG